MADLATSCFLIGYYIADAKQLIGRRFSDLMVQTNINLWPFKVNEGPGDKPMIVVNYKGEEKHFAAEEISSMVLIKMREIAEAYLRKTVKNVVVIVPAYFILVGIFRLVYCLAMLGFPD